MERLLSLGVRPWFESYLLYLCLDSALLIYTVRVKMAVIDDDVTQDKIGNWAT